VGSGLRLVDWQNQPPVLADEGACCESRLFADDIKNLLERIGGAKMSIEFVPSSQYPAELGFYRCYVKKPELDREKFNDLLQGYGNFLDAKKEESNLTFKDVVKNTISQPN
jgi:hypothetical protein